MPGYIRQYIQQAAPVVDIGIEGDAGGIFSLIPVRLGAMDPLLPVLELYPESLRERFSIIRPMERKDAIWIHPGEPVFERFRSLVSERLADAENAAQSLLILVLLNRISSTWRFFQ